MSSVTLTVAEIIDLAGFAGLTLHSRFAPKGDDLDAEVTISECPPEGVLDQDTNRHIHTKHIAYMTDCREEGCAPLGPEVLV